MPSQNKIVRIIDNDDPEEEFLLLDFIFDSADGPVAVCERLHDGMGMYKDYSALTVLQRESFHFKGKIFTIPINYLKVIE